MISLPAKLLSRVFNPTKPPVTSLPAAAPRLLDCVEYEERTLFSATPMGAEAMVAPAAAEAPQVQETSSSVQTSDSPTDVAAAAASVTQNNGGDTQVANDSAAAQPQDGVREELVFIDGSVSSADQLLADLQANNDPTRRLHVVMLDSNRDGISQISDALAQYQDLSAVHFVTHAGPGELRLGSESLTLGNFDTYARQFEQWRAALANDADLLFYGCELAASEDGRALLTKMEQATGADVAASTDNTGSAMFGGNWGLEYTDGSIETTVAFSTTLQRDWVNLLTASLSNVSTGVGNNTASVTVAHVASGSNRLMLVAIGIDPHGETVTSVTYNGASLTYIGSQQMSGSGDHSRVELWAMVAPSLGNHDVVVDITGTANNGLVVGVLTFTGVDQTTPLENFASNFGSSTTASVDVASQTGDLVFAVVHSHTGTAIAPGGSQTEYWDLVDEGSNVEGSLAAGAATVSNTWTVKNDDWTALGVSIRSASTNTAPTLDTAKSPVLSSVTEDNGAPVGAVGTLVSSLVDFSTPSGQVDNVSDADGGALLGIAVIDADTTNGSWWYSTDGGANWSALGSVAANNARLLAADSNTRLYFQANSNYNGTVSNAITFRAWDQTSGTSGSLVDASSFGGSTAFSNTSDTAGITVTAVNDAPVNTVPGSQSTNEDTALVFSSGNGNQLSIADVDAGSSSVRVTLTGTNGTVTLSGTTGLSFVTGTGTGDATMTFSGTVADINTALNGLSFTPTSNFTGAASLQIVTSDQGNTGSGGTLSDTDTVNITVNAVNDAPTNTVPGGQSMNEDATLVFSSGNGNQISIDDVDAGSSSVRVTLTATNGTVSLSGLTGLSFTVGDGTADATMTFSGTITNINSALNGLGFTPTSNFNGAAGLQIVTNDLGNTGTGGAQSDTDSIAITVNAVNDAPVAALGFATYSYTEGDGAVVFVPTGTVSDVDSSDFGGGQMQIQFSANGQAEDVLAIRNQGSGAGQIGVVGATVTYGGVAIGGWSGGSNGSTPLVITFNSNATAAATQALLQNITYQNSSENPSTLTRTVQVTIDDGDGGTSTPVTGDIQVARVNDAPVNTVPGAQSMNEDATLVFSSGNGNQISVADVDAGSSSVRVTLTATNGTVSLSGLTGLSFAVGDGTADATMTFSGTITNINTALNGLGFTPTSNFNGAAGLQIVTNDLGNSGTGGAQSDTDSIAITVDAVNDGPANTVPGAQTMNEDATLVFSSGNGNQISVGDVDAGASGVEVTLTASNGTLSLAGLTGLSFSNGDGTNDAVMTFTGTVANINAALNGLSFTAAADFSGTASLQIATNDLGNTGSGGVLSDTDLITITVSAVNDAPTLSLPAAQSTPFNTTLTLSASNGNSILLGDVDAGSSPLRLTLTASNGTVSLSQMTGLTLIAGTGSNDATVIVEGSLSNLNAAVDGLVFTPTATFRGPASIIVSLDDLGNAGSGGSQVAAGQVDVDVQPAAQRLLFTGPTDQAATNFSATFSIADGNSLTFYDVYEENPTLTVTIHAASGTFTLSTTNGLTFLTGSDGSSAMSFMGSLNNVNAALEGSLFSTTVSYSSLSITAADPPRDGAGPQSAGGTTAITQPPVFPAPSLSPATEVIEDITDTTTDAHDGTTIIAPPTPPSTGAVTAGGARTPRPSAGIYASPFVKDVELVDVQKQETLESKLQQSDFEDRLIAAKLMNGKSPVSKVATRMLAMQDAAWARVEFVDEESKNSSLTDELIVGTAGITASLSVGYVLWSIRAASLLSTMLSSMPAWQSFDPLPVINVVASRKGKNDDDDDTSELF